MITELSQVYEELQKPEVEVNSKFMYSSAKTNNRTKKMSLGRIWFNMLLPDDYKLINEAVTKKLTNSIMIDILNTSGAKVASDTLSKINSEAFKMQTIVPVTFQEQDFTLPDKIQKMKDDRLNGETDPVKFQEKLTVIANEYLKWLKDNNSGLYDIVASGAKGNATDIAVLLIARGSTSDFDGNLTKPSTHAVNDGYTLNEFYENANQARSALFIRSVGSAVPGDTSRITAFANSNVVLSDTQDCKTNRYLTIKVTKDLSERILQRYHMVNGKPILITSASDVLDKVIKLRSPLYCIQKDGICSTCYGETAKALDSKTIGLLASSVIGTKILNNFTMKSRHLSSSVRFKNVDLVKDLIR